jgi:DNA-binding NtrC family response regulator
MTKRPSILLVEDDEAMRSLLGASLRRRGFDVVQCQDGEELMRRLQAPDGERSPSLIVSDLRMPGVNGFDLLHWLGQRMPDIPVILITAFGDVQTHRRAKELGAAVVLDKPFDLEDFHAHVSAALDWEPDISA